MWEIAALVEVLERNIRTEQDFYGIIAELRTKSPRARIPETVFSSPYLLSQTEEKAATIMGSTRWG